MNLLQQFLTWFTAPTAAAAAGSPTNAPTVGDQLVQLAGVWLQNQTVKAEAKANEARATAPADNQPGATQRKSEAPKGQTLADMLAALDQ